MKIGILTLPFDNNYGGNLQRYALVKTLKNMGYDVKHIFLVRQYFLPWYKKPISYLKRLIKNFFSDHRIPILFEKELALKAIQDNALMIKFYNRYIPHTIPVRKLNEVKKLVKETFDVIVVGSDQIWRKDMTKQLGLENYFLKFLYHSNIRRIVYAASLGLEMSFDSKTVQKLTPLYQHLDAVSVRERFALDLFKKYGWIKPEPFWVLDPIFLLSVDDYKQLIVDSNVNNSLTRNKVFCYILDMRSEIQQVIDEKSKLLSAECIIVGLSNTFQVSAEQWLSNIMQSRLVITDSFHGVAFSILFNRPFVFMGNQRRGNARIKSLFEMFDIQSENTERLDWSIINNKISYWKIKSMHFLVSQLKTNTLKK